MIGFAAALVLLEAIIEQTLPWELTGRFYKAFIIKDIVQSLIVAGMAVYAARISTTRCLWLLGLALLNASLEVAVGMGLGSEEFQYYIQPFFPNQPKVQKMHRRYD